MSQSELFPEADTVFCTIKKLDKSVCIVMVPLQQVVQYTCPDGVAYSDLFQWGGGMTCCNLLLVRDHGFL